MILPWNLYFIGISFVVINIADSSLLNGDGEVALVVDGHAAIFFLDAWSCKLHRVGFLILLDIDCGCCTVGTFEASC